jgi:hydroxymethylpyrimidine pyrophosphatase-like HAD family hydrolase
MIIIANLNYYDDTNRVIPIEAESVEDVYQKVKNTIAQYRKDCAEYYWWREDIFSKKNENINQRLIAAREQREKFAECDVNFDIKAERTEFFKQLDFLDTEINKIEQERIDLINSRQEPRESDYANFRITGLDVSKWEFKTLDEWLKGEGEIYESTKI